MALSFTRKVNMSPGQRDTGDVIDAGDVNELQEALEDISLGTVPIPLAGIEGALGEYVPLQNMRAGVANVLDYGAVGDGVTDDIAVFREAIADLATLGGGTLIIPPAPNGPDYLWSSGVTHGGMVQQLQIYSDDITIEFLPGARIRSTVPGARVIIAAGAFKPNGYANWSANGPLEATGYNLSGAFAKGSNTITLATAAQAGNFAAGDDIFIRTGQTLGGDVGQPLSELNMVASSDSGTGVITLLYPLSHTYQQEYFISGTSGKTSSNPTANAALFQCANVSDRTIRRCAIVRPNITVAYSGSTFSQAISLWDGHTFSVVDPDLRFCSNGLGGRSTHHVTITNWTSHHTPGRDEEYAIGPSWGCSFWEVDGIDITSEGRSYLHIHEGVGSSRFRRGTIRSGAADEDLISIRARSGGVIVEDINLFPVMTADGNVVSVDDTCTEGGIIQRVRIVPAGHASRFRIDSPNWLGLDTCDSTSGRVSLRGAQQGYGHEVGLRALTGWVLGATANQHLTVALGRINEYCTVVRVHCYVDEAFNSDGTDQIVVGYSGATNAYATAIDVSTTGVKSVTLGTGAQIPLSANRDVIATYTAGGSAPTVGKARIIVEYLLDARKD